MTALRRALFGAFVVGLGLSITLAQTTLLLLSLLWLWELRDPDRRRGASWPLAAPILAFSGVSVLSALLSGHALDSLLAAKHLLLVAALYVTANTLVDLEGAERFVWGLVLVAAVAAALGLIQVGLCPGPAVETAGWASRLIYHRCARARGPFSIYMTLGGVLLLVLLVSLPGLMPRAARPRWAPIPWLVMLGGLVATYTRGAWLGFAAGVLALVPMVRRGRLVLVIGLVVLALGVLLGPSGLRQRLLSMGDPEEGTIKEREYMWRSGLAMWRQHPWLGWGPGGVKREYEKFALPQSVKKRTGHVHNTPLQITAERGVLGLATWLWIWAVFYRRAIRLFRKLPERRHRERALVAGSLTAVTGCLVSGLSEYNFGDSEVLMLAWAIAALPFVLERQHLLSVLGSAARRPQPLSPPGSGSGTSQ